MRYCVQFRNDLHCLDKVDEVRIKYLSKSTILDYKNLFKAYPKTKFLIQIPVSQSDEGYESFINNEMIKAFTVLKADKEIMNDFALIFNLPSAGMDPEIESLINYLRANQIEFFFLNPVSDWETLIYFTSFGVSSLYITDNFGFKIKSIYKYFHTSSIVPVKIRCLPNIAQSKWGFTDITSFFIRPEDVDVYEPYVDTLEIYDSPFLSIPASVIDTTVNIYKEKRWVGLLADLILNYTYDKEEQDVCSNLLLSSFGSRRLNCGRKCQYKEKCSSCLISCIIAKSDEKLLLNKNKKSEKK